MMSDWPSYLPSQNRMNSSGAPRRFGFEIEFHGLDLEQAVAATGEALGVEGQPLTEYEYQFETRAGTYTLERDVTWLKEVGRREAAGEDLGILDRLKHAAGSMAELFMPLEVVAPPLLYEQLPGLDDLIARLADAGASGTAAEDYYAFGVHVNAETWATDDQNLLRCVQAFAILQRHLIEVLDVDLARRLAPFITPWPDSYVSMVVESDYAPQRDQLIDDYLRLNPTRNRALDMLVLFAHLDEDRVRAALPDEKINPRPAFHFRLPNSSIGEPGWKLTGELRSWAYVEQLASSPALLERAAEHMRNQLSDTLLRLAHVAPDADWLRELHDLVGSP